VGRLVMAEMLRLTGRTSGADGESPAESLHRVLTPELVVRASSAPHKDSPLSDLDAHPLRP